MIKYKGILSLRRRNIYYTSIAILSKSQKFKMNSSNVKHWFTSIAM